MIDEQFIPALKEAAMQTSRYAYAPYSKFPVGAAVLTGDRDIYSGCNVENISYGLSICAERNAIFQAITHGAKKIVYVVIYTPTENPTPPCGACRQVINEFADDTQILCFCNTDAIISGSLAELYPHSFEGNRH